MSETVKTNLQTVTDTSSNVSHKSSKEQRFSCKTAASGDKHITKNIVLCSDNKYRWIYELNLFTNPSVILLLFKIFFFILLGIFIFLLFIGLLTGNMNLDYLISQLKVFGVLCFVFTCLIILRYLLYAAVMGGKYIVIFEMTDRGITHRQISSQAKKAKKLGRAAMAAGLAAGSFSSAGAGAAAQRTEMSTDFKAIRKVKIYPRRHLIKLNERLEHNQIYAEKEDFDFILKYILERVSEDAKPNEYRNI